MDVPEVDALSVGSSASDPEDEEEGDPALKAGRPDEEGRYYDDALWYGKTIEDIRRCTVLEKDNGNAESRNGEWKLANRCWKNALKGAEKLQDAELELRLRLNLALGYVKREKPEKTFEQCDAIFRPHTLGAASPALRAKAHFRRAEAYELTGETSKAIASLRAALENEAGNTDARRKLAALRQAEGEKREREKAFFSAAIGKPDGTAAVRAEAAGAEDAAAQQTPPAAAEEEAADESGTEPEEPGPSEAPPPAEGLLLTDRARSSRLLGALSSKKLGGSLRLNMDVGDKVQLFGAGDAGAETLSTTA